MARPPNAYAMPMTPVTPEWADRMRLAALQTSQGGGEEPLSDPRSVPPHTRRGPSLLPSALEMTPPQSISRKADEAAYPIAGPTPSALSSAQAQMPRAVYTTPGNSMLIHPAARPTNSMPPMPAMGASYPMPPPSAASMQGLPMPAPVPSGAAPASGMRDALHDQSTPFHQFDQYSMYAGVAPQQSTIPSMGPHSAGPFTAPHGGRILTPIRPPTGLSLSVPSKHSGRVMKKDTPQRHNVNASVVAVTAASTPVHHHASAKEAAEYASQIKDRYRAYNHYILRQVVDDKSKVVWSPEVEAAFMEAVWLIPGGQRKIVIDERIRGRNELIGDYLEFKLSERRTRKQVSSHLQVLKKLLAEDDEFLALVGSKPDEPRPKDDKTGPDINVESLAQLIAKLRAAKRNQPKPSFLLQAEANLHQSRISVPRGSHAKARPSTSPVEQDMMSNPEMGGRRREDLQITVHPPSFTQGRHDTSASTAPSSASSAASVSVPYPASDVSNAPLSQGTPEPKVSDDPPPLHHPKPVHPNDAETVDAVVPPPASVPPSDTILSLEPTPQSLRRPGHVRHHSRSTSSSVDLSGDRVLPVQFRMIHRASPSGNQPPTPHIYSRLLRPAYESPLRPLQLNTMLPKFTELQHLHDTGALEGVQILHANAALNIRPVEDGGAFGSDVQYIVPTGSSPGWQYRYIARTVIATRGDELLRCDIACNFHHRAGRGLEQDKDVVLIPFLPDFWSDFLRRLQGSNADCSEEALKALRITHAIFRVAPEFEELAFVALYEFTAAPDEFSARTRFRRVKGLPPKASSSTDKREEPNTPTRGGERTPTRGVPGTPGSMLGALGAIGTPGGHSIGSLGSLLGYESPAVFVSPHRMGSTGTTTANSTANSTLDTMDLTASPFASVLGESRGSPRSSKFEIQRAMTAFEPAAWDEMHDWIFS